MDLKNIKDLLNVVKWNTNMTCKPSVIFSMDNIS